MENKVLETIKELTHTPEMYNYMTQYYIEYIKKYFDYCDIHKNDIIIPNEIINVQEYFEKMKKEFENLNIDTYSDTDTDSDSILNIYTFYNHFSMIAISVDIYKNEKYTLSLDNHIKSCNRKRKIRSIVD